MRFTANAAGTITELRYFRGAADANDTDTRVLNLWNAAGVLLGSVTVSSTAGESGWQVGTLSAPIAIRPARPTSCPTAPRRTTPPPPTTSPPPTADPTAC